ncbi:MAG TPA: CAP domain-containing protein [Cytophagales bacterium]|nr:CAP domain-containing protein [Cytophagales bacterium]
MNRYILMVLGVLLPLYFSSAQNSVINSAWTAEELSNAHTAVNSLYHDEVEKETILYLNLARLYPKKFAQVEVTPYDGTPKYVNYVKGSKYKSSLIKELRSMKAVPALLPDSLMADNADCFAKESGVAGITGHKRIKCPKLNLAECCSYGMDKGRDIALQLLIDEKVASLGHRKICLDPSYSKIGVGFASHIKWGVCCVLEII